VGSPALLADITAADPADRSARRPPGRSNARNAKSDRVQFELSLAAITESYGRIQGADACTELQIPGLDILSMTIRGRTARRSDSSGSCSRGSGQPNEQKGNGRNDEAGDGQLHGRTPFELSISWVG